MSVVNLSYKKAAQKKINSVRTTSKFKKRIIDKEWEHATLKMKIEQLEDDLNYFERLKVRVTISLIVFLCIPSNFIILILRLPKKFSHI